MITKRMKNHGMIPDVNPQHTPTPWTTDGVAIWNEIGNVVAASVSTADTRLYHTKTDYKQASVNAAFLVRAVNAHEELLDAVKMALDAELSLAARIPRPLRIKFLKQAIAKAEGR